MAGDAPLPLPVSLLGEVYSRVWAQERVFLTFLTVVDRVCIRLRRLLSVHIPEMG